MEYKVVSKKTVYKSEKVQVDKETIVLPNGKIVEWDVMVYPDFLKAVPIREGKVLMTKEWRQGPHNFLTQFTGSRASSNSAGDNLKELRKELEEELGVIGGDYEKTVTFYLGPHLTGRQTIYFVTNFQKMKSHPDPDEILYELELPIKGLYNELSQKHMVTAETLLIAKLLEERFA